MIEFHGFISLQKEKYYYSICNLYCTYGTVQSRNKGTTNPASYYSESSDDITIDEEEEEDNRVRSQKYADATTTTTAAE